MKFSKSVTLDLKTIDLIDLYMVDNSMINFSKAVCEIIKEHERFKKIISQLQKK